MKKVKGNFDLLLKMKNKTKTKKKENKKEINLNELSYDELQELAKENDIKANQKTEDLIKQLSEVL